ncbi:MAG: beta/gamma crystallin-related protein [Burkholderiales bacterium]
MNRSLTTRYRALAFVTSFALRSSAFAAINFYEHDNFRGRVFYASGAVSNFSDVGFNDKASAAIVVRGLWKSVMTPIFAAVAWCCDEATMSRFAALGSMTRSPQSDLSGIVAITSPIRSPRRSRPTSTAVVPMRN